MMLQGQLSSASDGVGGWADLYAKPRAREADKRQYLCHHKFIALEGKQHEWRANCNIVHSGDDCSHLIR